ncbi:MAG: 1-acyl-sn-glycerol-3-phosphate acyltransferase [Deltaproteobacteria bacterium]|nr:1-acyl-sn-glycerol-3-phosphate acyltransferase [Deltaproteobacteria bacterium]
MATAPRGIKAAESASAVPFSHPLRRLWGIGAALAIFFMTLFWGTLSVVMILVIRKGWPADACGRIWCRWILQVCGIEVELIGAEHIDPQRRYVIISNHLSNFDIWATFATVPAKIRFVAKRELLRFPVFGQALALSDHIIIDRAKPEEAVAIINQRAREQIGEGFCILFYAEGTRSPDGKVHAFKKGGVSLALQTGLPIIPLSISGAHKFLPKHHAIIRPGGKVRIVLAPPIETAGRSLDERDRLTERVRNIVVQNFIENY